MKRGFLTQQILNEKKQRNANVNVNANAPGGWNMLSNQSGAAVGGEGQNWNMNGRSMDEMDVQQGGWDQYNQQGTSRGWETNTSAPCHQSYPNPQNGNNTCNNLQSDNTMNDMNDMNMSTNMKKPILNTPFLMQNMGVPKNALTAWFGKRYKNTIVVSNKCFTTWANHEGANTHNDKYTSIFKCPLTGEYYAAGKFGRDKAYTISQERALGSDVSGGGPMVDVVWYSKKISAEHAAAARALDCLSLREANGNMAKTYGLCEEKPYLATNAPPLPACIPDDLLQDIMGGSDHIDKSPVLHNTPTSQVSTESMDTDISFDVSRADQLVRNGFEGMPSTLDGSDTSQEAAGQLIDNGIVELAKEDSEVVYNSNIEATCVP